MSIIYLLLLCKKIDFNERDLSILFLVTYFISILIFNSEVGKKWIIYREFVNHPKISTHSIFAQGLISYATNCTFCPLWKKGRFSRPLKNCTDLTLPAESPEQLIGFKFALLVGNNSRHLEDKSWFGLFVQSDGFKGQHSGEGRRGVIHRMHFTSTKSGDIGGRDYNLTLL